MANKKGNLRFKNFEQEVLYRKKGIVHSAFLNQEEIKGLKQVFYNHFKFDDLPDIYDTMAKEPVDKIKDVSEQIVAVCKEKLDQIIENYKVTCCIYFTKKKGDNTEITMHVDPSMTHEDYNNIGIWIPLVDVDNNTGRMCLLEGGQHLMPPYYNAAMPAPYLAISDEIIEFMRPYDMKAGEALFFNNSIPHYSEKNITEQLRIAAVIKIVDDNAPVVTAYYDPEEDSSSKVKIYEHHDAFFISEGFKSNQPPKSSKFIKEVNDLPIVFKPEDLPSIKSKLYSVLK